MPRLVVEKGRDKGKVLALRENGVFLVGRDLKTNLRLRDLQASRRHFKITYRLGEVRLEDLDSSNGTIVNGERVRSRDLQPNDKIQVGETLIFYLEDESQDDVGESPAAARPARDRKGELTGREIGGYRIGRLLGRGGMGTVYEATQLSLDRKVAFKVLSNEFAKDGQFVDRFTAEARAAGRLNHPNIVQVYDVGFASDVRFYSMEFMAGGSVEDVLRADGKLDPARALPFVFDAARGLEYAERHGIVHRDIKPDNLMLTDDGVVKIGDLGIATRRRAEGEANPEEGVSGSPHYIAPEQAMGRAFDHRADLYALGVSLYEMLSGECPYEGSSAREVILKHLNEPAPPLASKIPDVPPDVAALVARLMEKDPARRVPSASVLLQELVPLVRKFPLSATTKLRIDGIIAQRTELQIAVSTGGAVSPSAPTGPVPAAETASAPAESGPAPAAPTAPPEAPAGESGPAPSPEKPRSIPVSRKHLVQLVGILVAVALGVGAFGIWRQVQASRERARAARRVYLDEARALLATDAARCEQRAKGLVELFEAEGALAEMDEAKKLVLDAGTRMAQLEEEARGQEAARAFDSVRARIADWKAPPEDKENLGRYELQVKLFEEIAAKFEGTRPADAAAREREEAAKLLAAAKAKRAERLEREERAVKALRLTKAGAEDCCSRGRFDDAAVLVEQFEQQHGTTDLAQHALPSLRAHVEDKVREALAPVQARADEALRRGTYREAREALASWTDKLVRFPSVRAEVTRALDKVTAAEQAATQKENETTRAEDEARVAQLEESTANMLAQRQFDAAAGEFEFAAFRVKTPSIQERLTKRAQELRWAAAAVARLVALVRAKRDKAGIEHLDQQGGRRVRYVAYDMDEKRLRLRELADPEQRADLELARASVDELHDWLVRSAGDQAEALLDTAAVSIEVGDGERASRDLARIEAEKTLDGAQKKKLAALKAAAAR